MSVDALPILAFKIAEAQFDIASAQSFISIRDQHVRVRTLLTGMKDAGLFAMPASVEVLVIGSGYAGVNAAMWLSDRQVRVTLIDTAAAPFSAQRHCTTRFLSITQYDWPATHHDIHDYPDGLYPAHVGYSWLATSYTGLTPFHLHGSGASSAPASAANPPVFSRVHTDHVETNGIKTAQAHAADWDAQFNHHLKTHPLLTFLPRTRAASLTPSGGGVDADLIDLASSTTTRAHFTYVLIATGFGADGDAVQQIGGGPDKQTRSFWTDDTLATVGMTPPRILISGDGDGALQDFLRAVVDPALPTASEIRGAVLDRLRSQLSGREDALDASWRLLEQAIMSAETQALQMATWWGGTQRVVWNDLHRAHRQAMTAFASSWAAPLVSVLASIVDRQQRCHELTLVYSDEAPGKVYALNRLLSMLFLEYFDFVSGARADFFGALVPHAVPSGGVPRVELLKNHSLQVTRSSFDPRLSEYHVVVSQTAGGVRRFDVDELLIRHGTRKAPPLSVRIPGSIHEVGLELGRIRLPYIAAS